MKRGLGAGRGACVCNGEIVTMDDEADEDGGDDGGVNQGMDGGRVASIDFVEAMAGLVELVVELDLPADAVNVGDLARAQSFNAGEKRYHLRRCRGSTWQSGMEQGKPYGGVAEAGMVARSGRAGAAGSAAGYARAARRRWDGARADRAAAWGQGAENDEAAGMGPAAARERGQQRLRRGRYRGLARTSGPGRGGRGCRG